ncbi:MAG: cellulase family glycosylhydrolase [Anaerolineae bacterium]
MPGFIRPNRQGTGFIDSSSGAPYVPMGANYFDPKTGWAPKIWSQYDHERVARQLGQMSSAGFNTIRVFLDVMTLNPKKGQYSEGGLVKVDDLVRVAGQNGLRIIFSGPNFWHGMPEHRRGDMYADPAQTDQICALWQVLAGRYGHEPTIMTWDLFNEPMVGWPKRGDMLFSQARLDKWQDHARAAGLTPGDDLIAVEPDVSKELWCEYVRFQEELAEYWTRIQCEALRSAGARQMISVGLIQWSIPILLPAKLGYGGFRPQKIAKYLDYISTHFYPILMNNQAGLEPELQLQRAYLQVVNRAAYIAGKPLVLEEFGWKGGKAAPGDAEAWPEEHQTLWGNTLIEATRDVCNGWLNWGYADAADPQADISAATGLWTEDEVLKHWGKRFSQIARQFASQPPVFAPAKTRWQVNRFDFLYDHQWHPDLQWLKEKLAAEPSDSVEVVFTD